MYEQQGADVAWCGFQASSFIAVQCNELRARLSDMHEGCLASAIARSGAYASHMDSAQTQGDERNELSERSEYAARASMYVTVSIRIPETPDLVCH